MQVLLIDADVVAHKFAWAAEEKLEFKPGVFTWWADLNVTKPKVDDWLNEQMEITESDDLILVFSSPNNFRLKIEPNYKSNRKGKYRPLLIDDIRKYLETSWRSKTYNNLEADDAMGIIATANTKHDYIVASIDKDLNTIPGRHYNWSKPELGIYEVSDDEAAKMFYTQALSGDPVDGYPGCPGIGQKRASRIVEDNWPNPWKAIVEQYQKKDLDEEFALKQARMAKILSRDEYDLESERILLWKPPD